MDGLDDGENDGFETVFEFDPLPRIPIGEEEEEDTIVPSPVAFETTQDESESETPTPEEEEDTIVPSPVAFETIQDERETPTPDAPTKITSKKKIRWLKGRFERTQKSNFIPSIPVTPENCLNPHEYFQLYFTPKLIELIAEKTNMYAMQSYINLFVTTTDIEDFLALHILMGIYKLPRIKMYWSKKIGIPIFQETMARDKFFRIRNCFHVVDNLSKPETTDIFWKVRPLFQAIRNRCLQLPIEQYLAVDEQMVPFTGRHQAKQYVRGKPCPWGFKLFMLCGQRGLVYDFLIYQGSSTEIPKADSEKFGYGGAVVLKLSNNLKPGHCLFF